MHQLYPYAYAPIGAGTNGVIRVGVLASETVVKLSYRDMRPVWASQPGFQPLRCSPLLIR
jgi:hypothetical protein